MLVKFKVIIVMNMHRRPVPEHLAVNSVRQHTQKRVAAPLYPKPQGGHSLTKYRLEAVRAMLRKHTGGTAPPREPQHTPERVIILDAQSIVGFFSVTAPQAARV